MSIVIFSKQTVSNRSTNLKEKDIQTNDKKEFEQKYTNVELIAIKSLARTVANHRSMKITIGL